MPKAKGKKSAARPAGKTKKTSPARRVKPSSKANSPKTKKKAAPAKAAPKKLKKVPAAVAKKVKKAPPARKPAPAPVQPAPKAVKAAKPAKPEAPKTGSRVAKAEPKAAAPAPAKKAPAPPKAPKPRRSRSRIQHATGMVASWFPTENRPRPSSFIPAPPRAEAPSLIAAPPASSDRLVHPADLAGIAAASLRLFPVRIDIEQFSGKVQITPRPEFIAIRPGEGLEWDFRYLAGTDAVVDEVIIEFDKPSPFPKPVMKSRKPGSARPHRQVSGAAAPNSSGKTFEYRIRCLNIIKAEVAMMRATLVIT